MASLLYKWLLLLGWALPAASSRTVTPPSAYHPFYIGVTEINQNAAEKTLEISCKLFAEDLEAILEKNNRATLDITTEKDKASFDKWIPAYIQKNLSLSLDGKSVALRYVGFEAEKESAFCYFEVDCAATPKRVDITNSILQDFSTEQINIIHVTVNGKRQSTKLVYPGKQAGFSF